MYIRKTGTCEGVPIGAICGFAVIMTPFSSGANIHDVSQSLASNLPPIKASY